MNRIKTATRTLAAAAILGTGMASAPAFADDAGARPAERLLEQAAGNLLSAPAALPPSAPVALPSSAPGALPSSAPGALPPSAPEAPVCSTRVAICRSTRETNLSHTAIEDSGGKAIQLQRVRLKLQLNAFGVSTFCAKANVW
jgi:hypothetical protein